MEQYDVVDGVVSLGDDIQGTPYRNVQRRGEDSQPGVPMLKARIRLGAPEIAVIASAGLASVAVSRQPNFMVVSTGDELIEPGTGQSPNTRSGAPMPTRLWPRSKHAASKRSANDHIVDNEVTLAERLRQHLGSRDVLIVSGGVSKGKFDLVPRCSTTSACARFSIRLHSGPGCRCGSVWAPLARLYSAYRATRLQRWFCLTRYVIPGRHTAMATRSNPPQQVVLASPSARVARLRICARNSHSCRRPRSRDAPSNEWARETSSV